MTTFIEGLDGVDFDTRATVKIRQRYEASVPRVIGPVGRAGPVYVDDARFLVSQTSRPVKYQLPGRGSHVPSSAPLGSAVAPPGRP